MNQTSRRRSKWAESNLDTPSKTLNSDGVNLSLIPFVPYARKATRPTTSSSSPDPSHRSFTQTVPTPLPNSDQPTTSARSSPLDKPFTFNCPGECMAVSLFSFPENRNRKADFRSYLRWSYTAKYEPLLVPDSLSEEERRYVENVHGLSRLELSHCSRPISDSDDRRVAR